MPIRTLFYADILGYASLSSRDVNSAAEALDDLAMLFSDEHELARLLQEHNPWSRRYGLSDSIMLLADDPVSTVTAAAQLFFRATYLNASVPEKMFLLRGSIVRGECHEVHSLFKETASANLLGPAVVAAVNLEKSGAKGPRLLISEEVFSRVRNSPLRYLVSDSTGYREVLWPLAHTPTKPDISMLRPLFAGAFSCVLARWRDAPQHYAGFLSLLLRSVESLQSVDAEAAEALRNIIPITELRQRVSISESEHDLWVIAEWLA